MLKETEEKKAKEKKRGRNKGKSHEKKKVWPIYCNDLSSSLFSRLPSARSVWWTVRRPVVW